MHLIRDRLHRFVQPDTYRLLFYEIVSFPLGLFYFLLLVLGVVLGLGLSVVVVGIGILPITLLLARTLVQLEAEAANVLLRTKIKLEPVPAGSMQQQIRYALCDLATWRGIAFLLLKFPLGLLTFSWLISLGGVAFSGLTAPFRYANTEVVILSVNVDSSSWALFFMIIGGLALFLLIQSAHWIAQGWAQLAVRLLDSGPASFQPPAQRANPVATNTSTKRYLNEAQPLPDIPTQLTERSAYEQFQQHLDQTQALTDDETSLLNRKTITTPVATDVDEPAVSFLPDTPTEILSRRDYAQFTQSTDDPSDTQPEPPSGTDEDATI